MEESAKDITISDNKDILGKYENVIFDCDGVLWHGDSIIDGVADTLYKIIFVLKKKVFFISNDASSKRTKHYNRVIELVKSSSLYKSQQSQVQGFEDNEKILEQYIDISQFYNSAYLIAEQLKKDMQIDDRIIVCCDTGFGLMQELKEHQFNNIVSIYDLANQFYSDDRDEETMTSAEFGLYQLDESVKAVVVTYFEFNYRHLCITNFYLDQKGVKFYATNEDTQFACRNQMTEVGVRKMADVGSFLAASQSSLGFKKDKIVVGKPHKNAFDLIEEQHFPNQFAPKDSFLIIGDNLFTDIKFGKNCGIDQVLVLSGVTHKSDYHDQKNIQNIRPTYILNSINDLIIQ